MSETLQAAALRIALTQLGVKEQPPGSNRGPEVDGYLFSVGLAPGAPWCAAFVYWCFAQAAHALRLENPLYKTAGVLNHWNQARSCGARLITRAQFTANPKLVQPGQIMVMDFGAGRGHTGIVESVNVNLLNVTCIEGNSNSIGAREGVEVVRKTRRLSTVKGFIDYGARDTGKLSQAINENR